MRPLRRQDNYFHYLRFARPVVFMTDVAVLPALLMAAVEAIESFSKAALVVAIACWNDSITFGVWAGRFRMKACIDLVMS